MKSMAGVATLGDLASAIGVRTQEAAIVAECAKRFLAGEPVRTIAHLGQKISNAELITVWLSNWGFPLTEFPLDFVERSFQVS